jgi:hypothetical protein
MTKLQSPLTLHGAWEVAMVELIYPNTAYNVPVPQTFEIRQIVNYNGSPVVDFITVPAGIYEAADLIECINGQVPDKAEWLTTQDTRTSSVAVNPAVRFSWLPSERRTRITFRNFASSIVFPEASFHLKSMLGFTTTFAIRPADCPPYRDLLKRRLLQDKKTPAESLEILSKQVEEVRFMKAKGYDTTIPNTVLISEKCINTAFGNQTLFVYCDIADFQVIGDTVAPILRTVPIRANSAFQTVVERFDYPHYVRVIRNYIETIEVSIVSDLGKDVQFKVGKSLIKLHLRKAGMV